MLVLKQNLILKTWQAYASTYFFMYIVYTAWFLFLKGALKQALCGQTKEKVDAQVEETRRDETVDDKKEQVTNDQQAREETAPEEGVDSTNNLELPDKEGSVEPESDDPSQIAEADVVESLIELKPSVVNWEILKPLSKEKPAWFLIVTSWQCKIIIAN